MKWGKIALLFYIKIQRRVLNKMAKLLKGIEVSNPNGENISSGFEGFLNMQKTSAMERFTKKVKTTLLDEGYSIFCFSLGENYSIFSIQNKKIGESQNARM